MTLKMAVLRSSQRSNFNPEHLRGQLPPVTSLVGKNRALLRIFSRCLQVSIPYPHGVGRGARVGRTREVGVALGVAVAVGVGVGVGEPDCAQYFPPVFK